MRSFLFDNNLFDLPKKLPKSLQSIFMKNNIFIRPLEKDDLPLVKHWLNSHEISRIMGYLPVLSNHEQLLWFEGIKKYRTAYVFAICIGESGEHIGNIGLGNIDFMNRHAMLNIFIADHENRGKGYGRKAISDLLDFAFNRLNLNKVYLQTSPQFKDAVLLYERIGFVKEGAMRQHYACDGEYHDKLILSMLRKEYEQLLCRK